MSNLLLDKSEDSTIRLKAGTVIFSDGQNSKNLFIVKSGQVRLLNNSGQRLSVISICNEKEILNEVSVLTSKPTKFAAIAKTDVELILVAQKDILAVVNSGPPWILNIFKTLCERLQATNEIIVEHNLNSGNQDAETLITKEEELFLFNALWEYKTKK